MPRDVPLRDVRNLVRQHRGQLGLGSALISPCARRRTARQPKALIAGSRRAKLEVVPRAGVTCVSLRRGCRGTLNLGSSM